MNIKVMVGKDVMEFPRGIKLIDIVNLLQEDDVFAALINGREVGLDYTLDKDAKIFWIKKGMWEAERVYNRTVVFLFGFCSKELLPDKNFYIEHSISEGLFIKYENSHVSGEEIEKILKCMVKKVEQDIPIKEISYKEGVPLLFSQWKDKKELLKYFHPARIKFYQIEDYVDFFTGPLLPSTSFISEFEIVNYESGFILRLPRGKEFRINEFVPQPRLFEVFQEYERWLRIIGASDVPSLNRLIKEGQANRLIAYSEALHNQKLAFISKHIKENRNSIRLILISGPSSSGKTTFSKKLMVNLKVNGITPVVLSLDDYFLDRDKTPLNEEGKPDYESPKAIDVELFKKHVEMLIKGEEVSIPKFNFITGRREDTGEKVILEENNPIIVEGIHCLNPYITKNIPDDYKYKIYVSALTQLNLDRFNRISTHDTRLLRRMIRDSKWRNHTPYKTMVLWKNVVKGEKKYIFPYQEEADVMFNTALVYEWAVLKRYAEGLLRKIKRIGEEYVEARRLLNLLSCFLHIDPRPIPSDSILREFIGGSLFRY